MVVDLLRRLPERLGQLLTGPGLVGASQELQAEWIQHGSSLVGILDQHDVTHP